MPDTIWETQNYLRQISFEYSEIPRIVPDGIFGSETTKAVKAFQQLFNLHEDGVVGFETWEKLVSVHKNIKFNRSLPQAVIFFNQNQISIEYGDEGDPVYMIQIMLKALTRKFVDAFDLMITGRFDSETQFAVKKFQEKVNLIPTGIVDKKTWNMLAKSYEIYK